MKLHTEDGRVPQKNHAGKYVCCKRAPGENWYPINEVYFDKLSDVVEALRKDPRLAIRMEGKNGKPASGNSFFPSKLFLDGKPLIA